MKFASRLLPLLGLALGFGAGSCRAAEPARLNVLFIVVDDLNTDVGTYGLSDADTPNIDRLVARGVKFERAYCQFPLCSPSRESFLSGLRPETSGSLSQPVKVRTVRPGYEYLPKYFKNRGYRVTGVGKVFHGNDATSWTEYGDDKTKSPEEAAADKHRSDVREEGKNGPEWYPLSSPDEDTSDGIIARTAAKMLEQAAQGNTPFFVAAGFHKPHLPWTAPQKYFDQHPPKAMPAEPPLHDVPAIALRTDLTGMPPPKSDREAVAAYRACVSFIDAQVGVLTATMDRLGLWDKTVVVFVADHGFHLGDHNGLWAKLTDFERGARVPLAIVTPHSRQAGRTTQALAELVDLYPTLADLCGLPPPHGLDGRSLAPLLADPTARGPEAAYTTTIHEGVLGRSVRTDRWRYTEWDDGAKGVELYDQKADPGDYNNLAADPNLAAVRAHLKALLARNPRFTGQIPDTAQTIRAYQKRAKVKKEKK